MEKLKIEINGHPVRMFIKDNVEFVCITDIAKADREGKENQGKAANILYSYIKNPNTVNFLFHWEKINNSNFKVQLAQDFKINAGVNSFYFSVSEWTEITNAIGFIVERGRYGGTYAHRDIAYHFANWFDARFYVFFIQTFNQMALQVENMNQFYLEKIFNNSIENANLSQFLKDGQKLSGDEKQVKKEFQKLIED